VELSRVCLEWLCECAADDSSDKRMLTESLSLARDILNYINRQVDEHEKEQRLFTIYNKLDARSYTLVNASKFKVRCLPLRYLAVRILECLHDPANVQQTSSKCIQNTRANAGRLLDRANTLYVFSPHRSNWPVYY